MGTAKPTGLKVLHLEQSCYPAACLEQLEANCEVDYFEPTDQQSLQAFAAGKGYEAIFTKLGISIDQSLMESLPNLSVIITPTTGLNHIDEAYASTRNIQIISLRGETAFLNNIVSTAEHTWALLLALSRHLPAALADVRLGNWRRAPFMASELGGKTLGIIGFGRLGKIVAQYAAAFRMKLLVYDNNSTAFEGHTIAGCGLGELLANSDIVTLHIPSNDANKGFFDASKFEAMKPGSLFINTSRGEVVDEAALLNALNTGHLAGAATDVLTGDSTWESTSVPGHPLIDYAKSHENLLITPHMGGYGKESIFKTRDFVTDKFFEKYINSPYLSF